jgi:hypothetical protein
MVRSCALLESFQVGDRVSQQGGIVEELGKPAIAVKAQYASHSTGSVVVIDVLGLVDLAHGADAVLLEDEPFDRDGVEVVATSEMELPCGAMMFLVIGTRDFVMAWLAVVAIA